MPLYEYTCRNCETVVEAFRPIARRDRSPRCVDCSTPTLRIVSAPTMWVWKQDRKFPNLRHEGDGCMAFETKARYEAYLTENHLVESGLNAPVKRPHGNRVVGTWK